jgi:hypothetical protein
LLDWLALKNGGMVGNWEELMEIDAEWGYLECLSKIDILRIGCCWILNFIGYPWWKIFFPWLDSITPLILPESRRRSRRLWVEKPHRCPGIIISRRVGGLERSGMVKDGALHGK